LSPARAPTTICFDYGGTLVQIGYPEEGLLNAGAEVADLLGIAGTPAERRQLGAKIDALVDQMIAEAHLADPLREVDIYRVYGRALESTLGLALDGSQVQVVCHLFQRPWKDAISVDPQAASALYQLKRGGARLGLLSNSPYPALLMREMLAGQGLQQPFDAIVFSSEVGVRKPAPQAFATLLDRLGSAPGESWFVGDEWKADIEGSAGAGMTPILAPLGRAEESAAGSDVVRLKSWPELLKRWLEARQPGDRAPA
jgi:putative hydrolase of the HAD superfamily